MERNQTPDPQPSGTRDRFNARIVALGAAVGLSLAGLGIAAAQTDSSSTTTTTAPAAAAPSGRACDGPHHGPGHHHGGVKAGLSAAAGAIGISEEELRTALRSGQSIAQVAQSKNVAVDKVVDAMVADVRKRLADKVAAGDLTQEQADRRSAMLEERITALVNRAGPGRMGHPPGGGHGPGARSGATPTSSGAVTNA